MAWWNFVAFVFGLSFWHHLKQERRQTTLSDRIEIEPGSYETLFFALEEPGQCQYSIEVLDGPPIETVLLDGHEFRALEAKREYRYYEEGSLWEVNHASRSIDLSAGEYVLLIGLPVDFAVEYGDYPLESTIADVDLDVSY
ncbi:hypothetical protein [Natrarchaeobaculum sulfurireducens]|nr:hypothetical protein [Natrarchaeobaculum sulfurireducens]